MYATVPPMGVYNDLRYRIWRSAAATGNFNLAVKNSGGTPIASLTGASQWCAVTYSGSSWLLPAKGSLT